MKRFTYIFTLFTLLSISACNSFLEIDVIGKNDTETFFAEIDGLRAALPGAYRVTYNFYDQEFLKYGDVAGNMLRMSNVAGVGNMTEQYNFTSDPTQETTAVGYLWKRGFIVMSNVNNIINYADELRKKYPNHVSEIDDISAQAHFLRALMHFNLSLCYAQPYSYTNDASHWGVPVLTKTPSANTPVLRATSKQTYQQITDDLNKAKSLFSDSYKFDPYYASPLACDAMLARVHLYMEKWQKAEQYASEVIDTMHLTPRDEYVAMYSENQLGKESIFRLSGYDAGKQTSAFYRYGSALAFPADTLYTLFEDDRDIRINLLYYRPDTKRGKNSMKYYLLDTSDSKKVTAPFVLRLSEMYLIRAEAKMQQDNLPDAIDDLKTLEARALGVSKSDIDMPYSNKSDVDRLIEIERIKELNFEGHRFFDIARQKKSIIREKGTSSSVQRLDFPDYRFALPIPLIERDANPEIQQNEGYE